MSHPTIDGDSSNICHVAERKSSRKSETIATFYINWAYCSIVVVPVVDGDIRLTCKLSSNECIARREKNRIESSWLMAEANKKKREITNGYGSLTANDLIKMDMEISDIEKKSRSKFSWSEDIMPSDFSEALEEVLVDDIDAHSINGSGGFVGCVQKEIFRPMLL